MARHGDRRGFTAPQRTPQELAETLAELAASAGGPPSKRHRRGPQPAAASTRGTGRPVPRPTSSAGAADVSAAPTTPDLKPRAATTPDLKPRAAVTPKPPAQSPIAPAPSRATQTPVSSPATRPRPRRSPPPDTPAPIAEPSPQADNRPATGLVIGTPLVEASGARLGDRPRPTDGKARASNAASAGTRIRSRAAGPARQRRRLALGGIGVLGEGARRLRTPRPRNTRTDARSRKLRRLYAPLLLILAAVIIIGLVDHGKAHSTQPAHNGSESRSVFPKPTTLPTISQNTPAAPAVNTQPSAVTTTAHKNAAVNRANHPAGAKQHAGAKHAASHANAHQSSSSSSPAASTSPTNTISAPASQPTFVPAPPARRPAPPPSHTLGSSGSSLSAGSFVRHHHKKHS